jgi:hypothetical protein
MNDSQTEYDKFTTVEEIFLNETLQRKEIYTFIASYEYICFDDLIRYLPDLETDQLKKGLDVLIKWGYIEEKKIEGEPAWLARIPQVPVPEMASVIRPTGEGFTLEEFENNFFGYLKDHPGSNIFEITFHVGMSRSIIRDCLFGLVVEKKVAVRRKGLFNLYTLVEKESDVKPDHITNKFTLEVFRKRSLRKAILVHLLRFINVRNQHMLPFEITQKGMGQIFGKPQNILSVDIRRLILDKLIICELRHVIGQIRRLKTYFLTTEGIAAANDLLKQEMII